MNLHLMTYVGMISLCAISAAKADEVIVYPFSESKSASLNEDFSSAVLVPNPRSTDSTRPGLLRWTYEDAALPAGSIRTHAQFLTTEGAFKIECEAVLNLGANFSSDETCSVTLDESKADTATSITQGPLPGAYTVKITNSEDVANLAQGLLSSSPMLTTSETITVRDATGTRVTKPRFSLICTPLGGSATSCKAVLFP